MRVAVIGSTGGWHAERLERALTARGHECAFAPVTRMVGRIDGGFAVRSREVALDACDVVVVRAIPRGSLEQIVFRVDALHALAAVGVRAVNGALAIEHTIDKFLASALLAAAGVPDAADRRLRARRRRARGVRRPRLRRHRQAAVRLDGLRDGAGRGPRTSPSACSARSRSSGPSTTSRRRCRTTASTSARWSSATAWSRRSSASATGWRANLARGAQRPRRSRSTTSARALCVRAAAALGADYAGVDLLRAADGRDYVLEVNGIPGWHGRRGGDGGRRGGGARRAPGAHVTRAQLARRVIGAAVQRGGDQGAGRSGVGQRARGRRRRARRRRRAARRPGSGRAARPAASRRVPRRSRRAARSSTIASRAPASAKRASASAAAMPRQRRVGRDQPRRRAGRG